MLVPQIDEEGAKKGQKKKKGEQGNNNNQDMATSVSPMRRKTVVDATLMA